MNDTTATALAYGMPCLPEPDKPGRYVVFVDCGHTGTQVLLGKFSSSNIFTETKLCVQVAICGFNRGNLSMLASGFANSGGRNFDEEMCKYFAKDFAQRYEVLFEII